MYLNLVGFERNGFYCYHPDHGWHDLDFGGLPFHLPGSVPLGVRDSAGNLTLNPDVNYLLKNNDEIVILAEDDSTIKFKTKTIIPISQKNYL